MNHMTGLRDISEMSQQEVEQRLDTVTRGGRIELTSRMLELLARGKAEDGDPALDAVLEEIRHRARIEAEQRASEIVRDTYGPLLAPIRQLITHLALSPGEVIVSVAIREATGEIRIVHLDEAR